MIVRRWVAVFIEIDRVGKRYSISSGETIEAIAEVSLSVSEGEFVAILGPSGCGKSTLLKIVAGLIPASTGEVRVGGNIVKGPTKDVGIVFQNPVLLKWRRVLDNVLLPVEFLGLDRRRYEPVARELLRSVGLAGFEDRYPSQLSGGMQQRVAISRALIHDPKLLLMDEPFGALDELTRERMNFMLQDIWQNRRKTVLFVTHSITEALFLSDRIVVMTGRPSRVARVVPVCLPRPRTSEMRAWEPFTRALLEIQRQLYSTASDGKGLDGPPEKEVGPSAIPTPRFSGASDIRRMLPE